MRTTELESIRRWYVVRSKPNQENRAELNLRAWGVQTLFPRVREVSQTATRATYRVVPLFPNYLFASFDARQQLAKVRLTRGVQSVVGLGEYATAVDDSVISVIESRIDQGGYVQIAEPRPGDEVEIVSGPFRSFVGVFERSLSARDRVLILLSTIDGGARVNISKAHIRKSSKSRYAPAAAG